MNIKIAGLFGAVVLSSMALSPSAFAGGFLGDFINQVAPGVGTALDQVNAQLGNPVDHAAAALADTYVPGLGTAAEANWALQRMQNGGGGGAVQQPGRGFAQPAFAPQVVQQPGRGFAPPAFAPQQMAMGNFCMIPGAGDFGPGPIQPVGTPCFIVSPYGQQIWGRVN